MWLITSDLHLTDRPRDACRFGLFPWLAKAQAKHNVTATFILGDLTDQKDKHSSALVNRLVDELIGLKPPVYILRGNHDGIDPANPYFRFLSCIDGVQFITGPTILTDRNVAMIPHCKDQASFDAACNIVDDSMVATFYHQTIQGATSETGTRLNGLAWPLARSNGRGVPAYGGDIHRPQRLANGFTYIGSPYHCRFGDNFQPRVLLLNNGKEQNLYYPAPCKWSITVSDEDDILNNEDLHRGDQVMVTIELQREEVTQWAGYRQRMLQACKELGLEVFGCDLKVTASQQQKRTPLKVGKTPQEVVTALCQTEDVPPNIKKVGLSFVSD